MTNKIYFIRCEVNDGGWNNGQHYFDSKDHALKHMRNHVAYLIKLSRELNKKVSLKVLSDSVLGASREVSQSIFMRIDNDIFDFRIWCADVNHSELTNDRCYNY